jgi:leader peptidase (prepilin peptidase)/N-methyltransferase
VLIIYITVFVLGSLWGSFSNVCIYRLPEGGNIVSSRSACRNCQKKISWFDNIPFISFIILRGKCRNCDCKISFQYFFVELLVGLGFLVSFYFFGFTITTLLLFILTIFFVIIFFIDLKHFIIPNELTFPLMGIGFLKSFDPNLNQYLFPNYINSLVGGVIGYGVIWIIIFGYKKFKNKEGMGFGDAKLLSAIGFWFGWVSIPFILFFSSFVALAFAIPDLLRKSKTMSSKIPYGPYLVLGCVLYIFLLEQIIKFINL